MKCVILDILHSGLKGERGRSKVGGKYNKRKGKITYINDNLIYLERTKFTNFGSIILRLFEQKGNGEMEFVKSICTTELVAISKDGDYIYLETANSIYKLKII